MAILAPIGSIAANIQLAVAPVFLVTGVGSIIGVLATRIGRVVDRARRVEADLLSLDRRAQTEALLELKVLDRRMSSINWAIALCTLSALLVCIVIAILFLGEIFPFQESTIVAVLFIVAMALLITGLLLFLYEIQIAVRSVRVKAALLSGDVLKG